MIRLNLKHAGTIIKFGLKVATFGAQVALSCLSLNDIFKKHEKVTVGYSDTVSAIMDSDMSSSDKREAVEALGKKCDAETYKAIKYIVDESSVSSSDKAELIKCLCAK